MSDASSMWNFPVIATVLSLLGCSQRGMPPPGSLVDVGTVRGADGAPL